MHRGDIICVKNHQPNEAFPDTADVCTAFQDVERAWRLMAGPP